MRLLTVAIPLSLIATPAAAERLGGGQGGERGPLGQVSAGIRGATNGGVGAANDSASNRDGSNGQTPRGCYAHDGRLYERDDPSWGDVTCRAVVMYGGQVVRVREPAEDDAPAPAGTATVDFYAGAQKVMDSDGSASFELGVTQRRFRLGGTFSHYVERQPGAGAISMSVPTMTVGVRIDDLSRTAVILEGGAVHARTNGDVMGDSQVTGPLAGMRVERELTAELSLVGDVQQMWFEDDVRATAGKIGVRYRHVQASLRVLDFNVGPALWGPEAGVRF
jgi:hypothetical protein